MSVSQIFFSGSTLVVRTDNNATNLSFNNGPIPVTAGMVKGAFNFLNAQGGVSTFVEVPPSIPLNIGTNPSASAAKRPKSPRPSAVSRLSVMPRLDVL